MRTASPPDRKRAAARSAVTWSWQLKVELLEVSPTVWRRLIVPETVKLPKLHRILQVALGWTDSHLHHFVIAGVSYSNADPDDAAELDQHDERRVALDKALGMDARCFDYVYDFGDDWHHVVTIEERRPNPQQSPTLVHCSDGANACPPEDVGGRHGYAEFLAALADPGHEEHEQYFQWIGGSFDPRRFDIDAVNIALSKIKP
jgi:hypothetical protein